MQRKPIFHRPELGTTRADFEAMTEAAFWEVGASGRRYSREYVLDELEKRYAHPAPDVWETRDFHCLEIVQHVLPARSEEHTSELQSLTNLVCRLLLEKKKKTKRKRLHITSRGPQ